MAIKYNTSVNDILSIAGMKWTSVSPQNSALMKSSPLDALAFTPNSTTQVTNYSSPAKTQYTFFSDSTSGRPYYVIKSGDFKYDLSGSFSLSMWIKIKYNTEDQQIFIDYADGVSGQTYLIMTQSKDGKLGLRKVNEAGTISTIMLQAVPLPEGEWVHAVVTRSLSGTDSTYVMYINGKKALESFQPEDALNYSSTPEKRVLTLLSNGYNTAGVVVSDLEIADFAVWERVLSTTEIANIASEGKVLFGSIVSGINDVKKVMMGTGTDAKLVWPTDISKQLGLEYAKDYPYRIAFVGSSTTQGYNQTNNETYVHLSTGRFLRHVLRSDATKMMKQTTGTVTSPTAKGFHFLNAGLGGTTSANYLDSTKKSLVSSFNPTLIIHMIGSNDYSQQMALSTYKNNLKSAINSFPNAQHILAHSYRRTDRADTGITWAQYGQILSQLANEYPNVFFVDASTEWETNRNGATDWMQSDNIHSTWRGSQELAEIVCNKIGLEKNIGRVVWAMDATEGTGSSGNIPATADSLVTLPAISPSGKEITYAGTGINRYASLNNTGLRHADTAPWGAAFSFPMCFFIVVQSEGTANSTAVKPFFSRSNDPDDSWWWAWKDNNSNLFYSALNSAYSENGMAYRDKGTQYVLGVRMTPNNMAAVYVNSAKPVGYLYADRITETNGPWMKSLRIGANSSLANYSNVSFKEFRFELCDYSEDYIQRRMRELGAKHSITIDETVPSPISELNPFIWLNYTNQLTNVGTSTQTPTVAAGTASKVTYSNGSAYYNGVSHRVNSMPTGETNFRTIGCWYKSSTANSGYRSFIHVSDTANTSWEFYIGYNGNKIIMGCQIDTYWADLTDSWANINDGNWHFITAEVSQRISPTTTWDMKLRVDDRVFTKTLTGRSSGTPKVMPMFIGSDRTLTPLLTATWLDDVFYANRGFSDEAHRAVWKG